MVAVEPNQVCHELIPCPGASACRNLLSCLACKAIELVPGTVVTMTLAPRILWRMPSMVNQYCMCKLGGPWMSKLYNPVTRYHIE